MPTTIAVLGLGKAGGSLVASARAARVAVVARASRLSGLERTKRWLAAGALFLAVPDDVIEELAGQLAARSALPRLVVHMSGARGASALAALRGRARTGTFHPLAALDGSHPIPPRTFVALDGDAASVAELAAIARRMKLTPGIVGDAERARYHAGAVIAGNLATALLAHGVKLLVGAGVSPEAARVGLARLLASTAKNAIERPLPRALTGPVARGDEATIARHLALLDSEDPALGAVYRALSRTLVDDVAAHDSATSERLRRALAAPRARPPPRSRRA
jgi:predicted short-subunit dehydrogenase-like oxidoreductase (DUF2520 family)